MFKYEHGTCKEKNTENVFLLKPIILLQCSKNIVERILYLGLIWRMLKHKYGDLNCISDQQSTIHQELELTVNHCLIWSKPRSVLNWNI